MIHLYIYVYLFFAHSTLPRNTFSSLEQNDGGGLGNLRTGPGGVPPATLGERSKTLGPGFMRSHRDRVSNASGGGSRVESGYISSPDGNYEFDARTGSLPHHHVPHSREDKEPFAINDLKLLLISHFVIKQISSFDLLLLNGQMMACRLKICVFLCAPPWPLLAHGGTRQRRRGQGADDVHGGAAQPAHRNGGEGAEQEEIGKKTGNANLKLF